MRDGSDREARAPRPAVAARAGLAGALLGGLLLGGCTSWNNRTFAVAQGIANTGGAIGMPWRTMTPPSPEDAATIERIRFGAPPPDRLTTEPGDVWPGPQPQRTTLANPDSALRGIPEYVPPTTSTSAPRPPEAIRGSSSPPPPVMPAAPLPLLPPEPPRSAPPMPPRADGQIIHTPTGPVVTSGGTDRMQSFTVPGGGSGTAIRDGNTTTLIGPGGRVQVVPSTPR